MTEVAAAQKFTTGDPIRHDDGRQAMVLSVLADRMIVRLLGDEYGFRVRAEDYVDWERDPDPPAHEPWIDPPGRPSVCTPVILNGRAVGMQLAAAAAPAVWETVGAARLGRRVAPQPESQPVLS